jgi:hypothetical protein
MRRSLLIVVWGLNQRRRGTRLAPRGRPAQCCNHVRRKTTDGRGVDCAGRLCITFPHSATDGANHDARGQRRLRLFRDGGKTQLPIDVSHATHVGRGGPVLERAHVWIGSTAMRCRKQEPWSCSWSMRSAGLELLITHVLVDAVPITILFVRRRGTLALVVIIAHLVVLIVIINIVLVHHGMPRRNAERLWGGPEPDRSQSIALDRVTEIANVDAIDQLQGTRVGQIGQAGCSLRSHGSASIDTFGFGKPMEDIKRG